MILIIVKKKSHIWQQKRENQEKKNENLDFKLKYVWGLGKWLVSKVFAA